MPKNPPPAPAPPPEETRTKRLDVVALDLSCELSDDDRNAKARELVSELAARDRTLERHAEVKTTHKAELTAHKSRIDKLQAQASTGFETRPVTCDVVADYEDGVVRTIRRDTGATVKTRPLEPHERQGTLVHDDPGNANAEAFASGQIAGREGRDDNPYPEGSPQAAEWDRGRRSVTPETSAPAPASSDDDADDDAAPAPLAKAPGPKAAPKAPE